MGSNAQFEIKRFCFILDLFFIKIKDGGTPVSSLLRYARNLKIQQNIGFFFDVSSDIFSHFAGKLYKMALCCGRSRPGRSQKRKNRNRVNGRNNNHQENSLLEERFNANATTATMLKVSLEELDGGGNDRRGSREDSSFV